VRENKNRMAKIVKNNFTNFLTILVIFALVGGWWFSGWPRIWPLGELGTSKIRIPPGIQRV